MIEFLSNNLIDQASITASTTNAQYPVSNITDYRRTKTYRSTSNSDNIVIDFGTAESCDTFAVVDNWQSGFGVTSITIEANGTDSWGSPSFTTTATLDNTFGVSIKKFASAQSYRYWRIVLTSTLGYCELSNIFLGSATTITTNGVSYNWNYANKDMSSISENRYGQRFVDDIGSRKELTNLQFQVLDKDELDSIISIWDNNRKVKPFFVYLPLENDSLHNNDDRFNGLYYFSADPQVTNTTSGYYNTVFSLIEAK